MLRNPSRVHEAIKVCLQFGWKDSLPLLGHIVDRPSSLGAYRGAYQASRELAGKPIPAELLAAEKAIERRGFPSRGSTEGDLAAARRTIVEAADVEAATFVGISLATFTTKGNVAPVRMEGVEILRALPRATVEKMLNRLANGLQDDIQRDFVAKVLTQVL